MPDLFTIAHGAGGLWEVHKWNDDLELNTELEDGADRYVIESITGLHSLPERPEQTTPKVGRIGESFLPVSPNGKTITYRGEIQGSSVPAMRQLRTAMLEAFADTYTYGTMDLIPQYEPVYPAVDNSPTARFYAIVLSCDIPEEQTTSRFSREFTLVLRMIDPRVYFLDLAVDQTSIYPLSVTNSGSAPVDPVLHVAGVDGDVTVSIDYGDGETHTLSFTNCQPGTLDIDFGQRTAAVGEFPAELVVADSDWWDSFVDGIKAGATATIDQTGGTSIRVTFVPAAWG